MNMPKRMPVWASVKTDPIRAQWLTLLCGINALYALLTLFGKSDGAAQVLLRSILPVGTGVWGCLLLAAAVLIWLGWSVPGGMAGSLAWVTLATASLVSIGVGTALSTAGPVLPLGMAFFHSLVVFQVRSGLDEARERKQRGA